MLLHHHADFPIGREWQPICFFDVGHLRDKSHWSDLQTLCGIGEMEIYAAISEAMRRRFVLEDTSSGRFAGMDAIASQFFFLPSTAARYFRILGRAIEIAMPNQYKALGPFNFEMVDRLCGYSVADTQKCTEQEIEPAR